MKKNILTNILTGFVGQFVVIILGIIIPKLMINAYGSDVNGLVSTVSQIFTYLALLEAGIGQATRNALYKPIACSNKQDINEVLQAAKSYFKRITVYYAIGVIIISAIAPMVIKTNVDKVYVFLIVILEGLSGVISFYYIETPVIMLNADGKGYVNNILNLSNKIIAYVIKIIMSMFGVNIILLQFSYFVITVAKVIFYNAYFKKFYPWVCLRPNKSFSILKDRNSYILTEIAWTIFSSTDMIVISTFISTQLASVYSIYNMIFSNLNILLNSIANSISYILGQSYHEDIKKYEKLHDAFTSMYLGSMTILMSICYMLTIPFVSLYTKGITDINYIYPSLPILFCLVQLLSWSRNVSGNLTGIAGYAKSTSYISLLEAFTNITLSIILINKFGIVGVLLATVVALPLKVLWCIYISDRKVLHRSYKRTCVILGGNYVFFFCIVLISHYFKLEINSYGMFLLWGVILTIVIGGLGAAANIVINRDLLEIIKKYVLKR